jgi:hypothetical protein
MANRKTEDGNSLDLQFNLWQRAQSKKQATPTVPTLYCRVCPERPVFATERDLLRHSLERHHVEAPPKDDKPQEQEEPDVRLQSSPAVVARYVSLWP